MPNKILVYTSDLKLGMYIAELDRPWVDSPFLFQGFVLNKDSEINELRVVCEYVYVDVERSKSDVKFNLHSIKPNKPSKKASRKPKKAHKKKPLSLKPHFESH